MTMDTEVISAGEILAWGRDLVEPGLRAAVEELPASMRPIARYHFGWEDGSGGGKAIRPVLVLLAAQAVGVSSPEAVLPAAVAVELVHNFSLLHDDVMDGDVTRRHRPTVWKRYGVGPAILAGDALVTLATQVLAGSGHPAAGEGLRMLTDAVLDLVEGQSADLAFEEREDVGLAECRTMAEGKTGALLGCACALGALFGGGSREQIERLRCFGQELGLAFQFVDDLLGIWGKPAVTGKPVYSDLRNRKKSLPVVAALTSDTAAGRELAVLYHGSGDLSGAQLVRAADLVDRAGGRAWGQAQADALLTRARAHLHAAAEPGAARELDALAQLITRRDR